MNKKIIAIAIATAMAAPVAMADIKVTGAIGGELTFQPKENATTGTTGTADIASKAFRSFGDTGKSKLEFHGSNGNAYAKVGMSTNTIMGGQNPGARDGYIGYKLGGDSSIQMGRMVGAAANLEKDAYISTFLQSRNTAAEAATSKEFGSSSFIGSLIQYQTKAGAMNVIAQYSPTDNDAHSANDGHIGVSLAGKAGAVNYWASYNNGQANQTTGTSANHVNVKVGAAMKMGAAKLTLNVTDAAFGSGSANKSTSTLVMADFGLGNGLSANVGYGSNGDKGTWTRAAISKKLTGATVFAGAVSTKAAGSGTTAVTVFGAGMNMSF